MSETKLKLEVGKTYLNGWGNEITIVSIEQTDRFRPFMGRCGCSNLRYSSHGWTTGTPTKCDLVSEYDELYEKAKSITPEGVEFLGYESDFSKDTIDRDKFEYTRVYEGRLYTDTIDSMKTRSWDYMVSDHCNAPRYFWWRRPRVIEVTMDEVCEKFGCIVKIK